MRAGPIPDSVPALNTGVAVQTSGGQSARCAAQNAALIVASIAATHPSPSSFISEEGHETITPLPRRPVGALSTEGLVRSQSA